eukprot:1707267-Prymnesium_polylepis.1
MCPNPGLAQVLDGITASPETPRHLEQAIAYSELDMTRSSLLGSGAFGTVHKTRWRGTPIALKTSRDDCPDFEKRLFMRELETMLHLRHPNVVQFLGYVDSPFAIALEFLPNGDLRSYWQNNRLSLSKKIGICVDVLRALAYMHNRKPEAVIHRDVKPANVLMTASGVAKLSDFGLSRMTEKARRERSTYGGTAYGAGQHEGHLSREVGTKRYMAPEAVESAYTSAVDIFSSGATFYELFEHTETLYRCIIRFTIQ